MLTESGQQVGNIGLIGPTNPERPCALPVCVLPPPPWARALLFSAATAVLAQSADPKGGNRPQQTETDGQKKDGQRKLDEFAEAAKLLGGPAAHPECVWLGRRVVG